MEVFILKKYAFIFAFSGDLILNNFFSESVFKIFAQRRYSDSYRTVYEQAILIENFKRDFAETMFFKSVAEIPLQLILLGFIRSSLPILFQLSIPSFFINKKKSDFFCG